MIGSWLSLKRWPLGFGPFGLGTSTYLMLGTNEPGAVAAGSMYGSNDWMVVSPASRDMRIGCGSARRTNQCSRDIKFTFQDDYSDDAGTMKTEKRTVGPVYAISLSGLGESQRVLFLRLANRQEDKASRENATLKAIAETVWAFTTPR
jgi:hypothetical protein